MKLLILLSLLFSQNIFSKEVVQVGVYHFPPFVEVQNGKASGYSLEIIDHLNKIQDKYEFKAFVTAPKRRYLDFKNNRFDIMLFEDINWGWKQKNYKDQLDQTSIFMKGGEVYITSSNNKSQSYFKDLSSKTKVGFLGYHYKFAKFEEDEKKLKEQYLLTTVDSHESIIKAVINERFQIGIVTKSFLDKYIKNNPKQDSKLLISKEYDQKYNHRILFRKSKTKDFSKDMNDLSEKVKLFCKKHYN